MNAANAPVSLSLRAEVPDGRTLIDLLDPQQQFTVRNGQVQVDEVPACRARILQVKQGEADKTLRNVLPVPAAGFVSCNILCLCKPVENLVQWQYKTFTFTASLRTNLHEHKRVACQKGEEKDKEKA